MALHKCFSLGMLVSGPQGMWVAYGLQACITQVAVTSNPMYLMVWVQNIPKHKQGKSGTHVQHQLSPKPDSAHHTAAFQLTF